MKKYAFTLIFFLASLQSFAQCPATTAQIDLDINNVRARILNGGDLWWNPASQNAYYEIPIGSSKNSLYAGALWVGGLDNLGQIKVAAQTYRQLGSNDYWSGPISVNATTPSYGAISVNRCQDFDRFWPVSRAEVLSFTQGGPVTPAIQQWPGNGNIVAGELNYLAPFFDANNDGMYNYQNGDYPYFNFSGTYPINPGTGLADCNEYLFGDKSIWWVFNDVGNVKTETGSAPIGLEVRAQAFAYSSSDPDLNNATFYQYQIINRSSDSLINTFIGIWCDPDLGNAADDYVGCDVGLNMGYVYNGDAFDDGVNGYGLNPPACGIDFLKGPLADAMDGIDNDHDGIFDEPGEECLLSRFMQYTNVNGSSTGNMGFADDYYEYLSGYWLDGQQLTFGGDGRDVTNPVTQYMFSGGTDPLFAGQVWTMASAGILPGDMRFLQSAGPFTMAPGSVNYVKTAVLWTQAMTGGPTASLQLLLAASQKIQTLFDDCFTTTGLADLETRINVTTHPNPFSQECKLVANELTGKAVDIEVYDLKGNCIEKENVVNCSGELSLGKSYISGVYVVKLKSANKTYNGKIIKL